VIIPSDVRRKFDLIFPYLDIVSRQVKDVITSYCETERFAYTGRVKDINSLAEKIETGRYKAWSGLDDLFACSIIIPTLGKEPEVISFLEKQFVTIEVRRRAETKKDPSVFRFDASRYIGRLKPIPGSEAGSLLDQVSFEIQVRTAFEHAWSVTTHALSYKSTNVDWRHKRLAAQLRATIEQLDQVVSGFEESAAFITQQSWPEVDEQKAIRDYFATWENSSILPQEVVPLSWGRFCENFHKLILAGSQNRVYNAAPILSDALAALTREIKDINMESFPRSISLLQFCGGALCRQGFLKSEPNRYVPLVTTELMDIFPESRVLGIGFDFDFN